MNEIDDDSSYLDIPQKEEQKVWCKIGEAGNLEYVNWEIVRNMAHQFDTTKPEDRSEQMLIAKLMLLVREETLKELGRHD